MGQLWVWSYCAQTEDFWHEEKTSVGASWKQAENIGNGIIFSMDYADGIPPIISGGPLGTNSYIFNSFHLHWGGSEHTFSGLKFGAELHLVHYNSKYDSYETAQNQDDGLAVLGFVYVSVPRIDILRSLPFIPLVGCVREPGATFNETDNVFTYRDVIQQKRFKFASYQGSLTSPPYPESVTWLVAFAPIVIEENELKVLQSIRDSNGRKLLKNSRSTQKACGRKPIVYFPWKYVVHKIDYLSHGGRGEEGQMCDKFSREILGLVWDGVRLKIIFVFNDFCLDI